MGLIADFIVASPDDALRYRVLLGRPLPPDRYELAEYKNFTTLALEKLWALLLGEEWDVDRHRLETIAIWENGEQWLFRFPEEFVHLLSGLDPSVMRRTAQAWVDPREVPGNADELMPVLYDFRRLATQARQKNKGLYLWGSL